MTVPPPGAPQRVLLERFCSVVGIDPAHVETDVARTNPSLNAPQAELLRRVNDALGDRLPDRAAYHRLVNGYFAMTVLAAQSGPPLRLPMRYADRTRELYERMAKEIRNQGYDVVGDLADLEPTVFGTADGTDQVDLVASDANVAEAGVLALASMLEQRQQDLELIRELRENPRAAARTAARARGEAGSTGSVAGSRPSGRIRPCWSTDCAEPPSDSAPPRRRAQRESSRSRIRLHTDRWRSYGQVAPPRTPGTTRSKADDAGPPRTGDEATRAGQDCRAAARTRRTGDAPCSRSRAEPSSSRAAVAASASVSQTRSPAPVPGC